MPYALTLDAEEDLTEIWVYTHETWGLAQADKYYRLIAACLEAIGNGHARSKTLEGLPNDLRIHRCEHHYIFFMEEGDKDHRPIIIAILHERMDFLQRLKDRL